VANTAWTLGDDDGAAYEGFQQNVTIADDSNTHVASIFIKKDNDESRFPELQCDLQNGSTPLNFRIQLNTKTGEIADRSSTGTISYGTIDCGDWWRLWVSIANNSTGNTLYTWRHYPAFATTLGGTTQTTGTIVADCAQLELAESFPGPVVFTTTTAQTTNQDNLSYPEPGWFDAAGTVVAEYKKTQEPNTGFVIGDTSAAEAPLYTAQAIDAASTDGTNTHNTGDVITAGKRLRGGARWSGSTLAVNSTEATAEVSGSYDGSWGLTVLRVGDRDASARNVNCPLNSVMIYTNDVGSTTLAALTDYD
jgi:hypothetical protein